MELDRMLLHQRSIAGNHFPSFRVSDDAFSRHGFESVHTRELDALFLRVRDDGRRNWMLACLLHAGHQADQIILTYGAEGVHAYYTRLAFRQGARLVDNNGVDSFHPL